MKHKREIAARMLPVIIVMAAMLFLSLFIFRVMIDNETENCWEELDMVTDDVSSEVKIRFEDNLKILDLTADSVLMNTDLANSTAVVRYLETVCEETIYERIDILFPDERLVSLINGEDKRPDDRRSFDELLSAGKHISTRTKDPYTGKDSIFYFTPVVYGGVARAILIGAISCEELGGLFTTRHYSGMGQIFMVDLRDGGFLIDKWHSELGNIYSMGERELADGYEDADFVKNIMDGQTGEVAFYSNTNGKISFMSYTSVEGLPFSVSIFVQEDEVFKAVKEMRRMFVYAGIVEAFILLIYLLWNVYIISAAVKSDEKARQAELEKEKNAAKTRFLSSVSHDIRTPLNGIIGMIDVINMRGGVPEEIREPLEKIDISAKHLLTLAGDVLEMNELETGKLVFFEEAIDLCALADEIAVVMQPRAKLRGISYKTDTSALTEPNVLGSRVHITKILVNLIGNAIKYNNDNGSVWVSLANSGGDYTFTVRDTGIGMSEEFQKNMFEAFEQENAGARSEQIGHGLGLSIVKLLVDKMSGKIEVESKKGEGTTITVTLPLSAAAASPELVADSGKIADLTGTRLLLAEDNELNMEVAEIMLAAAGAEVVRAENGSIAADRFAASEPYEFDAVLMDLMMPVMDGCEATRKIRAMERPDAGKVPIVAMTASTFSEDIKKCRDAGMDEHIGKPLDMSIVIARLAARIQKYRAAVAQKHGEGGDNAI